MSQPLLSVCFDLVDLPIPGKLPAVSLCAQQLMLTHPVAHQQENHGEACSLATVLDTLNVINVTRLKATGIINRWQQP